MTINASARRYEIFIAKPTESQLDWLNVTDAAMGSDSFWSAADEPIGTDGLIRTTGQLELTIPHGREAEFDTWLNEDRWAIGNRVMVHVTDEAGTMRIHPRSGLYILRHPTPYYDGNWRLTIEIGDVFQLKGYREPDDDKSGIEFGVDTTRTDIINTLLQESDVYSLGVTGLAGNIPGSINYPIPKTQRSYIEQAGAVAIGGFSVLWQWHNQVRVKRLNMFPETRIFKHVVGIDDAATFELSQGSERPVVVMRVTGTGFEIAPPPNEYETTIYEYAIREAIREGDGSASVLAGIRTERAFWENDHTFVVEVLDRRARGLVIPESLYDLFEDIYGGITRPSAYSLITAEDSVDRKVYEIEDEGRLLTNTFNGVQSRGIFLNSLYSANPPSPNQSMPNTISTAPYESRTTAYEYFREDVEPIDPNEDEDSSAEVRRILARKSEPIGKIAAAANNWDTFVSSPTAMIPSEVTEQKWRKIGEGEWEQREIVDRAGTVSGGSIAAFKALLRQRVQITRSRSGNAQPPSAERRKPDFDRKEIQYEGEAKFDPIAGANNAERTRTITIDYATSDEQCEKLAKIFGDLYMGRHRAFRVTTIFRDEWFYYAPLCRIDVEYKNQIHVCVADSVSWVLGNNQAIVVADLARMGTQV